MREEIIGITILMNRNKVYIKKSRICGCAHCLNIFSPKMIREWTHDGETALCPHCSSNRVIGNKVDSVKNISITKKLLQEVKETYHFN